LLFCTVTGNKKSKVTPTPLNDIVLGPILWLVSGCVGTSPRPCF